jgi:hypothetical protein
MSMESIMKILNSDIGGENETVTKVKANI